MSDVGVLLCVRVADMPQPVQGSTTEPCDACGEPVWISPTSKAIQAARSTTCRCHHCHERIKADIGPGKYRLERPSDEQIAEVIRHLTGKGPA